MICDVCGYWARDPFTEDEHHPHCPRKGDAMAVKKAQGGAEAERFQALIRATLRRLRDELDGFLQTTHGRLITHPTIDMVGGDVAAAYHDPNAHSISNLSQGIRQFLIACGPEPEPPAGTPPPESG